MTPVEFCIEIYQIIIFRYYQSYTEIEKKNGKTDLIKTDFDFGSENFDSINFDFDFKIFFKIDHAWLLQIM
jgi:hypothetical protein